MSIISFTLQRTPQRLNGNFKPLPVDTSGNYEVVVQCDGICAHYDRIYTDCVKGRVEALDTLMNPDDLYENLESNLSGDEWEYIKAAIEGYDYKYIDVDGDVKVMANPSEEKEHYYLHAKLKVECPIHIHDDSDNQGMMDVILEDNSLLVVYEDGESEMYTDLGSYIDTEICTGKDDDDYLYEINVSMYVGDILLSKKPVISSIQVVGRIVNIEVLSSKIIGQE